MNDNGLPLSTHSGFFSRPEDNMGVFGDKKRLLVWKCGRMWTRSILTSRSRFFLTSLGSCCSVWLLTTCHHHCVSPQDRRRSSENNRKKKGGFDPRLCGWTQQYNWHPGVEEKNKFKYQMYQCHWIKDLPQRTVLRETFFTDWKDPIFTLIICFHKVLGPVRCLVLCIFSSSVFFFFFSDFHTKGLFLDSNTSTCTSPVSNSTPESALLWFSKTYGSICMFANDRHKAMQHISHATAPPFSFVFCINSHLAVSHGVFPPLNVPRVLVYTSVAECDDAVSS